jgi:TonB family protein
MKTTRQLTIAGFLAGSLFSALAQAQTISGPTVQAPGNGLAKPEASPLNPPNRFLLLIPTDQRPPIVREALVNVLVDVDASGKVDDVEVLDGFHDNAVSRLVEKAVEEMTFTPATQGGNPVAFEKLPVQILLRGANPPGITDTMREDLVKLASTMQEQDFKGAERDIDSILNRKAMRLFEMALLEDQLASVYMSTERNPEALVLSRIATGASPAVKPGADAPAPPEVTFPDSFLPPDLYVDALRKRVALSLVNNQTGEALQVYEMLKAAAPAAGKADVVESIAPQMKQVSDLLASEQPVGSAIKLVDGAWSFTMSPRRTFGVTALNGEVNSIDVACGDSPVRRLPFQNDSEWKIPDSWGQCDLIFRGKDGSTFNLYEYLN